MSGNRIHPSLGEQSPWRRGLPRIYRNKLSEDFLTERRHNALVIFHGSPRQGPRWSLPMGSMGRV